MLRQITFESIIKFHEYDLLLTQHFIYECRILFSFKQFLFHNFMLYRAENTCLCGGLKFQDLNAEKIPATRGL